LNVTDESNLLETMYSFCLGISLNNILQWIYPRNAPWFPQKFSIRWWCKMHIK